MLNIQITKKLNTHTLTFAGQFKQQFTGIMGSSGGGKTTLLRLIAGLTAPDSGTIAFDKTTWYDANGRINLPPGQRPVGFMFQDLALFPNLTANKNINFYQRLRLYHQKEPITPEKKQQLLETLEITPFLNESVQRLSGGQRQRVALCRALVQQPRLLLLDEPFTGLDDRLRLKTIALTQKALAQTKTQVIIVSHRRDEVTAFTDDIYELA
ncbi:hypothetical protein FC83_GL002050 [Agrilactobacillus composti DSM 18527 = JCM 14202]|uniref:ABC transporter domain-containing protein n=1 Tax=Agrilactobacillus composti DSM 18527 = JCM 14202 TaxID=1423734 RepID=X0PD21_9LACO|nr:ATP-binding cassette domain-containing protein [Agrilactobacillus composti]KRM34910.1 hypothetical protein FC83_GL002050 [Agrilactobacillus composti DSM 18527 = JCM 14202]GAF38789.1 molybdenum transport ATP-binding protein ModC [Agrilactobacillus composti DSM 18527 = JCM 14202]